MSTAPFMPDQVVYWCGAVPMRVGSVHWNHAGSGRHEYLLLDKHGVVTLAQEEDVTAEPRGPVRSPELTKLAEERAALPRDAEPFDEWAARLAADLVKFND